MPSFLIILQLIIPVWAGYQLTRTIGEPLSVKEKIPIGAVIGYTLSAWLIFLTSLMLKLGHASIWTTQAILIGIGMWCALKFPAQTNRAAPPHHGVNAPTVLFALSVLLLVTHLTFRIIFERAGGIYVGYDIPDISLHLSQITNFVYGENMPPENPVFSGTPLRYPFLVNLFCAALVKSGMPLTLAINIQSWILISATLAVYSIYAYHITDRNRVAVYIALLLLMFSGSTEFLAKLTPVLRHLLENVGLNASFVAHGGENVPAYYPWANFFYELIIPGRAFLFGLPLATVILCFLWWGIRSERKGEFIWAGILTGLLPLFHLHGYFSIVLFSFCLTILFRTRHWLFFYFLAASLSLPQLLSWLITSEAVEHSVRIKLGWMAHEQNVLIFWLQNLGVFLPLYLLGFLKAHLAQKNRSFILCGLVIFLIANIFLFAPWEWCNIKIFIVWYMISVPLVSSLFAQDIKLRKGATAILASTLLGAAIVTGLSKVVRVAFTRPFELRIYTSEEISLAKTIREISPPNSVFLAAPVKTHILYLAGRKTYLGHPEWTWSHGINYEDREKQAEVFYTTDGPEMAESIRDAGIDYIIFGPEERKMFRREDFILKDYFTKIHTTENYQIYRVESPTE